MSADTDFKKIQRLLRTLPVKLQRSVVTGAARAGAATVRSEVRERVAKDSKTLEKSISIKKRRTKKNLVKFSVYVKKVELPNGAKAKSTKQYAYYLEYGTKNMNKKPFLRPAYESGGAKTVGAARAYMGKKLPKVLKKLKVR